MILIIIENGEYTVYVHTNKVNGKRYVGITRQKPNQRWRDGKGYKQCTYFERAINKYGWDGFDHEIIADKLTEEEAKNMERLLIRELKTQDENYGYNISDGGDTHCISEDGRRRISENMRGEKIHALGRYIQMRNVQESACKHAALTIQIMGGNILLKNGEK